MNMLSGTGLKKPIRSLVFSGVIAALVFCAFFAYTHIDHDCTGEDCPVCLLIQGHHHLLKPLGFAGSSLLAAFLGSPVFLGGNLIPPAPLTGIRLKVRLNT